MPPDFKQLDNFFTNSGLKKESKSRGFFPAKKQLYYLPQVLSLRERRIISALLIIAFLSLAMIPASAFYHFTEEAPDYGGSWSEGMVGVPKHINPLLLQANDVDSDLANLIYAGLLKYDGDGNLIPDLAESYSISENGLEYTVKIRSGLTWHDEQSITADDVVFTILTAQNSDYSSTQRINWQGVGVEKIDDLTIIFKLKNRYAQFANNLTMGIIPKHVWEQVRAANFPLAEQNLMPVGSGPYKLSKIRRDTLGNVRSVTLSSFQNYALGQPYIDKIEIYFYESESRAIEAHESSEIDGLSFISARNLENLQNKNRLSVQQLKLPRYFAVFFNQSKSVILSNKNVRTALQHATDRQTLIDNILAKNATIANSPLLPGIIQMPETEVVFPFDPEKARELLKDVKEPLEFEITTSSWPELISVAEELKRQWELIGFKISIKTLSVPGVQQAIKDRDYSALLFGEVLGLNPDPFSFWHSSQKKDPGLNLALYDNREADKILEDARQTMDPEVRRGQYNQLQNIINSDSPVIMLYSPDYLYIQPKKIKNSQMTVIAVPSNRFDNINQWYIDTKRKKK